MPLTLLDYIILFLSAILAGVILMYIVLHFLEKRSRLIVSPISEIRRLATEGETTIETTTSEREELPVTITEWGILKGAIDLSVFSPEELSRLTRSDIKRVNLWIRAALQSGFLKDFSEREKKIFGINIDENLLESLERILNDLEENLRLLRQSEDKLLNLEEPEIRFLSRLGIKNLAFIRFDNIVGPELKYFLRLTRFIKKSLTNPQLIVHLAMGSEISYYTEIEDGDRIVITKYAYVEEDRELQNIIIGEIIPNANIETIKNFLDQIAQRLRGQGDVTLDRFRTVIREELRRHSEEISERAEQTR